MEYPFRNLVFEGGGFKAVAYAGALEALNDRKIIKDIKRIGGTSSGAIAGLLVGLNYDITEISSIMSNLNFNNFLDDNWGIIRDTKRLITNFGWYKGDFCRSWISDILYDKTGNPNATFNDILLQKEQNGFRDMYFIGTNLSTGYSEIFSFEHTPRMCIADAVRISMSIPFFFVAPKSLRGDYYTDGGILDIYPIRLFDRQKYVDRFSTMPSYYKAYNEGLKAQRKKSDFYVFNQETLGFRLASQTEIDVFKDHSEPPHHDVKDLFTFTWRVIDTLLESQNDRHLHSDDWNRTIYIDALNVKSMEADLTIETRNSLVESGFAFTERYFAWYDSTEKPYQTADD